MLVGVRLLFLSPSAPALLIADPRGGGFFALCVGMEDRWIAFCLRLLLLQGEEGSHSKTHYLPRKDGSLHFGVIS